MKKSIYWLFLPATLLTASFISYAVWSFALTDPNLFLSQNDNFVRFQTFMWHTVLPNRNLLTGWYLMNVAIMFISYLWLLKGLFLQVQVLKHLKWPIVLIIWLVMTLPLFISSNALSHDVFNYIFNAKMVLVYGADPHVKVALDYSFDNWTRFMHNTHTPAPYWYGWTALSLVPYYLGMGKFTLTWLLFRLYSVLALVLTGISLSWMLKKDSYRWGKIAFVLFNPLVLIETISNSHNDYFMLLPALWAMWLAVEHRLTVKKMLLAVLLLLISASTKMATILLLPILAWSLTIRLSLGTLWTKLSTTFGLGARSSGFVDLKQLVWLLTSMTLFLPLFLSRSQQFLPWYLSWPLVFVPLFWSGFGHHLNDIGLIRIDHVNLTTKIKQVLFQFWPELLMIFSLASVLRYAPWLWQDLTYSPNVFSQQKWLTWGIPAIYILSRIGWEKYWSRDRVASV